MNSGHRLSKSRIVAYLQCPKRLWLEVHRPELREESDAMQSAFAVGREVGDLARAEYPQGLLAGHDDLSIALKETRRLLSQSPRTPVFEATLQHAGVLIQADLMIPARRGWHMAEVKSAGEVKPYHMDDLAIQAWVARGAGIKLARASIRHIDKTFVYPGGGNYRGLFADAQIDDELNERLRKVPKWVNESRKTLSRHEPRRDMGPHCGDPFECPFKGYCASRAGRQPEYPVTLLPGPSGKKLAQQLKAEGFENLRAVPAKRIDNVKLKRIHAATVTGVPYRDGRAVRKFLAGLPFPRGYLDFETIDFAVPIWRGTRPFQQIPFQWSCHIEAGNGKVVHRQFLDLTGNDPSGACAKQLVADLKGCRTILVYNASFERGVIGGLGRLIPDLRSRLDLLSARIRDLLTVVREHYYHRDMLGSFKIKAVLPTLAPKLDYEKLGEVQDGNEAQQAYVEAINPATTPARRSEIERALRRYCELDSRAMAVIVKALRR